MPHKLYIPCKLYNYSEPKDLREIIDYIKLVIQWMDNGEIW